MSKKDDFSGFGYFGTAPNLTNKLHRIDASKLIKYGLVNYDFSYAGEDSYYPNGAPLVAFKWFNAYLSDGKLLLMDRTGYTSSFECGALGPNPVNKDNTPLKSCTVTLDPFPDKRNEIVDGNPFECVLINLEDGNVEALDMRNYPNKEGLIIPNKKYEELTESERDLYRKILEIEEKATEHFLAMKEVDKENKKHPLRFFLNKIFKKNETPALPTQEQSQLESKIEDALYKLRIGYFGLFEDKNFQPDNDQQPNKEVSNKEVPVNNVPDDSDELNR